MLYFFAVAFLMFLTSCSQDQSLVHSKRTTAISSEQTNKNDSAIHSGVTELSTVERLSNTIIALLEKKEYSSLSKFIHPGKGVRFSMYAHVDPMRDKLFLPDSYNRYIGTPIKFTFGEKDGTGDPYVVSLNEYLSQWVARRAFSKGETITDSIASRGNTLNNIKDIYPQAIVVEKHLKGSEKYGGMDWNSLYLVYQQWNGQYYIVGIANDQWTT